MGDLGSIPGSARSPGEGKGYPLQYCGLENSIDCIVPGVAKSQTRLSDFHDDDTASQWVSCDLSPDRRPYRPTHSPLPPVPLLDADPKRFLCICQPGTGVFRRARAQGITERVGRTYKNFYLWSLLLRTLCFPHASFPLSLFGGVSSGQSIKPGFPEPPRVVCSLFFLLRPCMSFYDRELLTEVCEASLCRRVSPHWYEPRQSCMMLSHLKKSKKKSCFAATALPDLYGVFTPNQ